MWILWKMRFWKCEFCEKWDFGNVNFVENKVLKMWILWKMWFSKCEFREKWDFQNVIFWINWGFLPQCAQWSKKLTSGSDEIPVDPVPRDPIRGDEHNDDGSNDSWPDPKDANPRIIMRTPELSGWSGPARIQIVLQHHIGDDEGRDQVA